MARVKKTRREEQSPTSAGMLDHIDMLAFWHSSEAREKRIAARVIAICEAALEGRSKRKVMEND